jgi:5-methylcytosine-specific restriction enzyme subunit McrC
MIPIENIYYLLCYAWNVLDEADLIEVAGIESTEIADLFGRVLIGGTNRVSKYGLDRGYEECSDDVPCVRGRIDTLKTRKLISFRRPMAHCHFDELTHNVLHNRILKTTLRNLADVTELDKDLRSTLVHLYRQMRDVEDCRLDRLVFQRIQLHRNNAFYRFLMNVCELINSALLVDENTGDYHFRDFIRDEKKMWRLFQDFVFNFYRLEQNEFQVKRDSIEWDAVADDPVTMDMLPGMNTDISLRSPNRTILIDTKYFESTLQTYQDKQSIRSEHLYQIFAYLKNLEPRGGADQLAEGILLYPTVTRSLDLHYTIQGHEIRVCTIDLSQNWQAIRYDLLQLLVPKSKSSFGLVESVA